MKHRLKIKNKSNSEGMACRAGKNLIWTIKRTPWKKSEGRIRKLFHGDSKQNRKKSITIFKILGIVTGSCFLSL
jgi:hypothetical protein